MVQGIEMFKAEFSQFSSQYVLIGGTACSILLEERNSEFRATKDLDIVLVIEALREDFVEAFCSFIEKLYLASHLLPYHKTDFLS